MSCLYKSYVSQHRTCPQTNTPAPTRKIQAFPEWRQHSTHWHRFSPFPFAELRGYRPWLLLRVRAEDELQHEKQGQPGFDQKALDKALHKGSTTGSKDVHPGGWYRTVINERDQRVCEANETAYRLHANPCFHHLHQERIFAERLS